MVATRWNNPRLRGRIIELDGIRGLAILFVVVWHYFLGVAVTPGTWQAYALVPFRLAWSGVDLFFVLSGFLIGGILYDAKGADNYFKTFYLRRFFRIFPVYFIWIALFLAGLYFAGSTSSGPVRELFNYDIPSWSYPLFLQNFFMSSHRTFGSSWLGATWSLAVEEQFYLLLPLFIRHLSYRGIVRLALGAVIVAPVIRLVLWWSGNETFGPYTLLPCRADALGFGVLIAMAVRNKRTWEWLESRRSGLYPVLAVLACGIAYFTLRPRYLYVAGLTWIGAFYATLFLLVIVRPGKAEVRIFGSQLLRKLGTVAYALYLIHEGINRLIHSAVLGEYPRISGWPSFGLTLISLTIALSAAALSWRFLEKPLIRRAHSNYTYSSAAYPSAAVLPSV